MGITASVFRKSFAVLKGKLFLISMAAIFGLLGCKAAKEMAVTEPTPVFRTTESGLTYAIVSSGQGETAQDGNVVTVHYKGKLEDGSVFDSSLERGEPIVFTLGKGQVITGWEQGIKLLRKGDKATFVIPPQLAYGENGIGPIPPNATLTFEVELVDISNPSAPFNVEGIAWQRTERGVDYAIVKKGRGLKLSREMRVKVHYNGFLEDGTLFDSSFERARPIEFVLGRGAVIQGWEEGLLQ